MDISLDKDLENIIRPEDNILHITRNEWRFVAAFFLTIFILSSIPYLYAYLSTPVDKSFMGVMLDVPDHWQYFSWMRELTGANFISNKLTPEANKAVFFNLLWWGMGRIGEFFGWNRPVMYQLLRFVSTGLFLIVVYRIIARFFTDPFQRRVALLVVVFTSGFGWALVLMKYSIANGELLFPMDVYIAEGNTFLGILGYPHFIAAALYVFVFDLVLEGERQSRLRYPIAAGLFALFLGWQHAYDLISVYGVLLAYASLRWLRDRRIPIFLTWSIFIVGIYLCLASDLFCLINLIGSDLD